MNNYTNSPRAPVHSVGGQDYRFVASYLRNRDPTGTDIKPKEQQGHYPVASMWNNTSNQNVWFLAGIVNNVAKWVMISGGGLPPLLSFQGGAGTSGFPVSPNGLGQVTLTSSAGTIAITGNGGTNTINFDVGGGQILEKIAVDTSSPPGTNPVVPASNQIKIEGGTTFVTGTQNNPIRTNSLAANTLDIETQLAGSNAGASTAKKFGVSQFDSNQFNVTSGFVQLAGGTGPAVLTNSGDTGSATPDGSGNIAMLGGSSSSGIVTAASSHQVNTSIFKWVNASNNNWIPVVVGTTGAGTATYIKQHAVYARVGYMIFFTFDLQWTMHTGTGNIQINGFPLNFALANTNYPYACLIENITLPAGAVDVLFIGSNATKTGLMQTNISNNVRSPIAMSAAGTIACYGFYFSDDP